MIGVADIRARTSALASSTLAAAGMVGLAAALRFADLDARGFWRDEAVTVQLMRKSFGGMLSALPHSEGTPPLYYVLAWVWTRPFGSGEVGLRSFSAMLGAATVAVVYLIGAHLFSHRVAVGAALLAAVNPLLVWHSQDGRSYALYTLLGAFSLLAFVRALDRLDAARLTEWAVASALALCTHYFALFLVLPEAVWLLTVARRRAVAAVGAVTLVAGALLPLALAQRSSASVAWIEESPRLSRVRELGEQFFVGPQSPRTAVLAALAGACVLVGITLLVVRGDEHERRGVKLVGGLAVAALALSLALSFVGVDYFLSRNLIVAWIPLALAVVAGLAGTRAGLLGTAALAGLVVLGLGIVVDTAPKPKFGAEDWRGAARALGPPGADRAVVLWLGVGEAPFVLYRPHAGPMPTSGALVREVDVVSVGTDHADIAAKRESLFPPAPFVRVGRVDHAYFTIVRFRSPRVEPVRPATLVSGGPGHSAAVLLDQR